MPIEIFIAWPLIKSLHDHAEALTVTRCPSCGARAATDAAWCTLCYARLAEPVGAMATFAPVPVASAPIAPQPVAQQGQGWPCQRCETVVALELSTCSACGAPFLTSGAVDENKHARQLARLTTSGPLKFLVMVGGALAVSLVLAGFFWLVSAFL
jgi:predicted amidophosphoribosyltransferase